MTISRRDFLKSCQAVLGAAALGSLGGKDLFAADKLPNPMAVKQPHYAPKVKNVIYLHMAGSPREHELFDY